MWFQEESILWTGLLKRVSCNTDSLEWDICGHMKYLLTSGHASGHVEKFLLNTYQVPLKGTFMDAVLWRSFSNPSVSFFSCYKLYDVSVRNTQVIWFYSSLGQLQANFWWRVCFEVVWVSLEESCLSLHSILQITLIHQEKRESKIAFSFQHITPWVPTCATCASTFHKMQKFSTFYWPNVTCVSAIVHVHRCKPLALKKKHHNIGSLVMGKQIRWLTKTSCFGPFFLSVPLDSI